MTKHITETWICDVRECNRSVVRSVDGRVKDDSWTVIPRDTQGNRKDIYLCPQHAEEWFESMRWNKMTSDYLKEGEPCPVVRENAGCQLILLKGLLVYFVVLFVIILSSVIGLEGELMEIIYYVVIPYTLLIIGAKVLLGMAGFGDE